MPIAKKKPSKNLDKFIALLTVAIIVTISLFNFAFYLSPFEEKVVYAYEETPQDQVMIEYWNTFLEENPDYLPGWLELAKLEIENDDLSEAFLAASEALRIAPNSDLVKQTLENIEQEN